MVIAGGEFAGHNGFFNSFYSIKIIFCTSNSSIELGKEVSQLWIQYYEIKPLDEGELQESFNAALQAFNKKISTFN